MLKSIIPAFIAGFRSLRRSWKRLSAKDTSARWARVGGWTRRTSKIKGQWKYLYRAVDRDGQTIDLLLTVHRDKKAARCFFKKAVRQHDLPDQVMIDKSGANTAAIEALKEETGHAIEIRQNQYLNH